MNAVAFCLYGANPKYLDGMLQNAWLMPRIYPGWECHVWVNFDVPGSVMGTLIRCGCVLHTMERGYQQRMFYRMLIHDYPGVERYLVRDADSRISMRERRCVDQWMLSTAILHTMHDHKYHIEPIQGGMFGIWREQFEGPTMAEMIGNWPANPKWGVDQDFLRTVFWPRVQHSVCEHGRSNPIPPLTPDEDPMEFVGEVFDQHGRPAHPEHRLMGKR